MSMHDYIHYIHQGVRSPSSEEKDDSAVHVKFYILDIIKLYLFTVRSIATRLLTLPQKPLLGKKLYVLLDILNRKLKCVVGNISWYEGETS